jgi:cytochrome c oxidase accessory protein FixG
VKGKFKNWHSIIYSFLLIFFLVLPWIKINGQQALFLDITHRKFTFFGLTLWAHDAPLLALVFISFVLIAGLVTSLFGRLWCGWACPQTVFIDFLYRRIERWIEGSAKDQEKLDNGPWTTEKLAKKTVKWSLFLVISLIITHSFLAYFVGADNVTQMVLRPPQENWVSFLFIVFSTGVILFDFGWFREQFCIIACPYGRFQSVIMDTDSLSVSYDYNRGEPRKASPKDSENTGDCISCYRCVQVCPTGIDIRRGLQLECIMCSACIDACDMVMDKIGKPKGLIRYTSERALTEKTKLKFLRPRVFIYTTLLIIMISALTYFLTHRDTIRVNIVRPHAVPYQHLEASQKVINHFKFNLRNQASYPVKVSVSFSDEDTLNGGSIVSPIVGPVIQPGKSLRYDVFAHFPTDWLEQGKTVRTLVLHEVTLHPAGHKTEVVEQEIKLVGPML